MEIGAVWQRDGLEGPAELTSGKGATSTLGSGDVYSGKLIKNLGTFGFIQPDGGGDELFVMPKGCKGFNNLLPPIGSRVRYELAVDEKTLRTRAENVFPESESEVPGVLGAEQPVGTLTGTIQESGAEHGYIAQDHDGSKIYCLPGSFQRAFGQSAIPPVGTRVMYDVVVDSKNSGPRVENVQPLEGTSRPSASRQEQPGAAGIASGTLGVVSKICNGYGFIDQDNGERMFVLPFSCGAFGNQIPPVGTRVEYDVVPDPKTGKTKADNVRPGMKTGSIGKCGAQFGFINQDNGEAEMFVLPKSCGGEIPPVGTRVMYEVVQDQKTGRPRAENVVPEQWGAPMDYGGGASTMPEAGTITQVGPTYGFIQSDAGEKMFVLPGSCTACTGEVAIPPLGTRVVYSVVVDGKTGRPRAENVRPQGMGMTTSLAIPSAAGGLDFSGTIQQRGEKYGFIQQDDGQKMFVMPIACAAFGSVIPPEGTRVSYRVVPDSKTGRPRAEDVSPEVMGQKKGRLQAATQMQEDWGAPMDYGGGASTMPEAAGTITQVGPTYGFIQSDAGEKMFVLPGSCTACTGEVAIPPLGTRVVYSVVVDGKTGRPRAENVRPQGMGMTTSLAIPSAAGGLDFSGAIQQRGEKYGFIQQDDGQKMFVMPMSCAAFGSVIPPEGTRVSYRVVPDSKTGQPRAEDVSPEVMGQKKGRLQAATQMQEDWGARMDYGGGASTMPEAAGTITQVGPTYGFIQSDAGEKMFVLPGSCTACTGEVAIPPEGTRVVYTVVLDSKTGRPRADNVRLEAMGTSLSSASAGSDCSGTIQQQGEKYGFILQDDGQKMFVMPIACAAFGSVIPPEGTRVSYRVVPDSKTGRPRAENVCPEGTAIAGKGAGTGSGSWGKADASWSKGKSGSWNQGDGKGGHSKGLAIRYAPY
ncbi:unnamed protein product [Symbiodinium natans]|uniref:Cold-shock domain-containing protein n=1 Tax=Symbiodinium natans TaxID=878477 RepID=A0A812LCF2_9DINO|nr:unnamed protein product [Symbiodinium natans]